MNCPSGSKKRYASFYLKFYSKNNTLRMKYFSREIAAALFEKPRRESICRRETKNDRK